MELILIKVEPSFTNVKFGNPKFEYRNSKDSLKVSASGLVSIFLKRIATQKTTPYLPPSVIHNSPPGHSATTAIVSHRIAQLCLHHLPMHQCLIFPGPHLISLPIY